MDRDKKRRDAVGYLAVCLHDHREAAHDAFARLFQLDDYSSQNNPSADAGLTQRRHVMASATVYIGKEANRWKEQSYLGIDPEAEVAYGMGPEDRKRIIADARGAAERHGQRTLEKASAILLPQVNAILQGKAVPTEETLVKLTHGMAQLETIALAEREMVDHVIRRIRNAVARHGLWTVARQIKMDAGNLSRILNGRIRPTVPVLSRLHGCPKIALSLLSIC